MEVMFNECRLLNLQVTTKKIWEDCTEAENSHSFREMANS